MLKTSLPITESFRPEYLEYYGILPLDLLDGKLRVAAAGRPGREVLDDLRLTYSAPVELVEAPADEIVDTVRALFSAAESTDSLVRSIPESGADSVRHVLEADARDLANQPPVVRFVNLLIREAFEARASDIHIEASEEGATVRFRVDGVLSTATAPPRSIYAAVVSRLKLIADLDIAERRRPQDGRIRFRMDRQDLDLRVSSVPTTFGESIVVRILDRGAGPITLESLGMQEGLRKEFTGIVAKPHGILLATGPTGSGKTTTLYAALQLRASTREKIITVEDPVEYFLRGVTQVPVNRQAGMTFAAGLRAILRQDPDVVMVGEMRDPETAHVAVQAAMTGHLVLSTMHTNDAASAISRLVDLGIEPYLIADTVHAVLAQRLVRAVCNHCSEWRQQDVLPALAAEHARTRRAVGCALCRHTGFVGRVGIFELLSMTDAVRAQVAASPDARSIRHVATEQGMIMLREDGITKVMAGTTTLEEVLRVVDL